MSRKSNNPAKSADPKPGSQTIGPREAGLGSLVGEPAPGRLGRKRGRKPSTQKSTSSRHRKVPPGRGGERLVGSVNVILYDECDSVARALINQTIAGKTSSARLLVELSGANRPSAGKEDKYDGPSLADELMSSGEWVDPHEWNQNPPLPGETLLAFKERTLRYLPPPKPDA
jgi:hypothetical protein